MIRATPISAATACRPKRGGTLTLAITLLCVGGLHRDARAQAPPPTPPATQASAPDQDAIKKREQELEEIRAQQQKAIETQNRLKAEIAAIGQDRTKLNQQLIDSATRVRDIEDQIADTEGRLRPLDAREMEIRVSLDSRRDEISEVLAALQRAGRRAPPALLVRPEDALESLRTAMLLGATVPEMRARARKLASDLSELITLRKNITEQRNQLAQDRDKLKDRKSVV